MLASPEQDPPPLADAAARGSPASPAPAAPNPPRDSFQALRTPARFLLGVNLAVLAACALLWNREALPLWLRAEYWGIQREAPPAPVTVAWRLYKPAVVPLLRFVPVRDLAGRDQLVVGDSIVSWWPWEADRLCQLGLTLPAMLEDCRMSLAGRHYARIILWTGSRHFGLKQPVAEYVETMAAWCELAAAHADEVIVISPMPYDSRTGLYASMWGWADSTEVPVAQALTRLQARAPGARIIPLRAWRQQLLSTGESQAYFLDGLHLTPRGFAELEPVLAAAGVSLDEAPWARLPVDARDPGEIEPLGVVPRQPAYTWRERVARAAWDVWTWRPDVSTPDGS